MRTSKLLELAALLTEYANRATGPRRLMAQSLAKQVNEEALAKEKIAAIEEQCEES